MLVDAPFMQGAQFTRLREKSQSFPTADSLWWETKLEAGLLQGGFSPPAFSQELFQPASVSLFLWSHSDRVTLSTHKHHLQT